MYVRKLSTWPHPIFAFCDYLSFKENMALYMNNFEFEFPLNEDDL
jgi:hypothetical protein